MSNGLQVLAEACKQTCDGTLNASHKHINEDAEKNNNHWCHPCYQVLYCKARGTPLDHQGESAILTFNIGEEYKHGALLKCSHHVCRQSGEKFRYCAFCKKAVAKRNFRKRHAHNDSTKEYSSAGGGKTMKISHQYPFNGNHIHDKENQEVESMKVSGFYSHNNVNQPVTILPYKQDCRYPLKDFNTNHEQHQYHPHENQNLQNQQAHLQSNQIGSHPKDLIQCRKENENSAISDQYEKIMQFYNKVNTNFSDNIKNNTTSPSVPLQEEVKDCNNALSMWMSLFKNRPKVESCEKDINDWLSEVCRVAGLQTQLCRLNPTEISAIKPVFDSNSHDFSSNVEDMSSTTLNYYDKVVTEVREEFKGIKPPRFDGSYQQCAESLSLYINTDMESMTSPSMMMLDSEGSSTKLKPYTFENVKERSFS